MWTKRVGALAVLGAAAIGLTVVPTASAANSDCDFSTTTGKYSCNGSSQVRGPNDVVGAKLFTGRDYSGNEVTIWVPKPCPKNNKVDYSIDLHNELRNSISSVQGWSTCWVWLSRADGYRAGPFQGNHPDVGSDIDNQAVSVGLS
ncbi:hypothetical protein [Kutzneria sp. CA-103260]|uniref:hypothetical protein n=1 Tax=Kutzneria sp. CA-103260 TaxID=2802641 RepID=UPI001BEDB193|nr:hypothetical protein [Kutzneria sp. CA-103260]QUQ63732.1 hypothetical protein JJ691_14450 [Kutzneria sp. CA-103260]